MCVTRVSSCSFLFDQVTMTPWLIPICSVPTIFHFCWCRTRHINHVQCHGHYCYHWPISTYCLSAKISISEFQMICLFCALSVRVCGLQFHSVMLKISNGLKEFECVWSVLKSVMLSLKFELVSFAGEFSGVESILTGNMVSISCVFLLSNDFIFECWQSVDVEYPNMNHDDVIKWEHFPRYWPFVRGIHRSPVNSQHKGQWHGALMFSLICVWINGWENNREAGDLRRYRTHYDVIVMIYGSRLM